MMCIERTDFALCLFRQFFFTILHIWTNFNISNEVIMCRGIFVRFLKHYFLLLSELNRIFVAFCSNQINFSFFFYSTLRISILFIQNVLLLEDNFFFSLKRGNLFSFLWKNINIPLLPYYTIFSTYSMILFSCYNYMDVQQFSIFNVRICWCL